MGYDFPSAVNLVFASGAVSIVLIMMLVACLGRWVDRLVVRIATTISQRRATERQQAMIEKAIADIKAAPGRSGS